MGKCWSNMTGHTDSDWPVQLQTGSESFHEVWQIWSDLDFLWGQCKHSLSKTVTHAHSLSWTLVATVLNRACLG